MALLPSGVVASYINEWSVVFFAVCGVQLNGIFWRLLSSNERQLLLDLVIELVHSFAESKHWSERQLWVFCLALINCYIEHAQWKMLLIASHFS